MYRYRIHIVTLIAGMIVLPSLVFAAPGIPGQFYGAVQYDSGITSSGLTINALVNGTVVATTVTQSGGNYGLSPNLFFVPDTNGTLAGTTITFTVNGVAVTQTAMFANASLTQLNLTVHDAPLNVTTTTRGGGGGGSGYYYTAPMPTPVTPIITTVAPATPATSANSANGQGQGQVRGAATFNFTKDFGIGSRITDVTELQKILLGGSHLKVAGPTGYFGALTLTAVKSYQKAHGVIQTGYVGPLTRAELNKEGAVSNQTASAGSSLTAEQVSSIIALIESFNVDAATMDKIRAALLK